MALNQRWQRCGRSCPPHPPTNSSLNPTQKFLIKAFQNSITVHPSQKSYTHKFIKTIYCVKKNKCAVGLFVLNGVSKYKCCGVFVTIDVCQNSSAVGCLSQSDLESTTSSARLTESPTCICCLRTSSISNICTQENLQKRHLVLKLSPLPLLAPWSQSIF